VVEEEQRVLERSTEVEITEESAFHLHQAFAWQIDSLTGGQGYLSLLFCNSVTCLSPLTASEQSADFK
jgi:hypothetical protein